jgi:surfactin family lipopeptide synthetase A
LPEKGPSNINSTDQLSLPGENQTSLSTGVLTADDLLAIWEKTLGKSNLHKELTYFEQGGTSLGALGILGEYYNLGYSLTMADFYNNPSAVEQAALLEERYGSEEHLTQDSMITSVEPEEEKLRYVPTVSKRTLKETGQVFITGGGGYLGIHLIQMLLETNVDKIYCLVRTGRETHFKEMLSDFFGNEWLEQNQAKLLLVNGDISKEKLGLKKADYEKIINHVDKIYHCAADVRHYADLNESMAINVTGTENVIAMALKANAGLHHISTTSVAADYVIRQAKQKVQFFEMDFDIGQNWKDNVYVHTKFLAEDAIYRGIEQGLDARIYRVGRLVGRASDGKFQENPESNAFFLLMRAIRLSKAIPASMMEETLELTPVDECAQAIVALGNSALTTMHLATSHLVPLRDIIRMDHQIVEVPDSQYEQVLRDLAKKQSGPEITPLLDYINGRQNEKKKITVSSMITQNELIARGKSWQQHDPKILLSSFFNKN